MAAIEEMDAFVASLLAPTAVIPRHRVSPSASPMTGFSGVSSTLRLLDSIAAVSGRSEEHTSELQSRRDLVCRLLLEKKKLTQPRAAALPYSTVTPAPSLPLAISLPCGSTQTCPETNSRFPVRTKPR